ncbi:CAP domain-containing protein [Sphingomonas cavernae]|uniref:SCP-like extracellular n=1 Tax=Sphingomonas cavernae TaxID=2320861 RepID=A0A418WL48_9SPHN|nr:CAP domain-containing protein [Sphingomonas cavernae]RJF90672.1 SCP-like extracellular [Sphingomonas cavernae]
MFRRNRLYRGVRIAALMASAGVLAGASLPSLEQRLLYTHNAERATEGLPAMRWDAGLAADAAAWARHLAASGRFDHYEEFSDDPDAQGENLWMGTRGAFAPETMVGHWIEEKRNFKPGTFPNNSRTGDLADVGHYTQIMWRDTGSVGCAIAKNAEDEYLVCRYAATGNVIGERPF